MAKNEPKYKPKPKTKPETKPETKTMVLDCPDCERNREFIYSGYFTMAGGKEAHVRSCGECGFKRHFTPEGIPFGKTRNRKVLQDVPSSKELNRLYLERYPRYVPKITPPKGLEAFPSQTSGLNTHGTGPKTTSQKGLEAFLSKTSSLSSVEKGLQFELFCQQLLKDMGYEVKHVGQSGDRGVDLRATRRQPIGNQTLVVQCKHQQSVSADVVIQLYGMATAENANSAVVITTGAFAMDAKKFAQEHSNIEIIDIDRLTGLTNRYLKDD